LRCRRAGQRTLADITHGYDKLVSTHGVRLVRGRVVGRSRVHAQVKLDDGSMRWPTTSWCWHPAWT
jgi:hypothetical protein